MCVSLLFDHDRICVAENVILIIMFAYFPNDVLYYVVELRLSFLSSNICKLFLR